MIDETVYRKLAGLAYNIFDSEWSCTWQEVLTWNLVHAAIVHHAVCLGMALQFEALSVTWKHKTINDVVVAVPKDGKP